MNISLANLIKQYYHDNKLQVLSDIDDTDSINNGIPLKHVNNMPHEHIITVFRNAVLNQSTSVSPFICNEINTGDLKYDNIVKATNKTQLLQLLYTGIILLGHQGNFNWIDTSIITDMEDLFEDSIFNGDISRWDVSNVENMNKMFHNAYLFNQNISNWDVSNVRTANYMFCNAKTFNQNISNWNVFNMQSMQGMFNGAISFNQDISTWCIQSHCDCEHIIDNTMLTYDKQPVKIFESTVKLLADLDDVELGDHTLITRKNINTNSEKNIIVSLFKSIIYKFDDITDIDEYDNTIEYITSIINNPDNFYEYAGCILAEDTTQLKRLIHIGCKILGYDGNFNWIDTSKITDMSNLFYKNREFNGHIELWDISNVTNMRFMFYHADKFNQPIGDWDVSNVINMSNMFYCAEKFNQPIGNWDVSNVTTMEVMFSCAREFNQPIGDWDVSSVTNMRGMFSGASEFNQTLNSWDVSNVNNMSYMFSYATSFNQPLNNWTIHSKYNNTASMFMDCPIKEEYKPKGIKEEYKPKFIK